MENREFYDKYQNNQLVPIDTSYGRGTQGTLPLLTVAHLVAAYKTAVAPRFDHSSLAQLTLHSISNGLEATYNSWGPLTVLGENGRLGTSLSCMIRDTISMNEHMLWPLPQPVYDNPGPSPNNSGRTWKKPMHVFLWSGFKQSVVGWINDNHSQHSQRVQRPVFVPRVITEEVQSLQPFILDNLLDVSAKCFIPPSEFTARRQITT
jgi:hypothetical protein